MTTLDQATNPPEAPAEAAAGRMSAGVVWAVLSAAAFGVSGPLAKSLLDLGWSPATLVAARLGGATAVLAVPALVSARGRWRPTSRAVARLAGYGIVATGGAQLCFFNAVRYLPIGTAILLEFSAPIWLIAVYALRQRRRPRAFTVAAGGLAVVGMSLVLDVLHAGAIDLRGLAWGLGAAACLCGYYLLGENRSDRARGSDEHVPPLVTAAAGTGFGACVILVAAALGLLPWHAAAGRVELAGSSWPWLLPLVLLIMVPTVAAYALGLVGIRLLGGAAASFVGLAEVLFAVGFSAVLVGQLPGRSQLLGMVLVVAGIALAQRTDRKHALVAGPRE